jgi:D-arginine dehydrogenase
VISAGGSHFDAVVIGAGIAGVSAAVGITSPAITSVTLDSVSLGPGASAPAGARAFDLTTASGQRKRVLVLESEADFCFHSTGRSAAIYSEVYGSPSVRLLSTATKPFYYAPAASGLDAETPLVARRPALHMSNDPALAEVNAIFAESSPLVPSLRRLTPMEAVAACPWLLGATEPFLHRGEPAGALDEEEVEKRRAAQITGGLLEPDAATMDVDVIWHTLVRLARRNGASFVRAARVSSVAAPGTGRGATWGLTVTAADATPAAVAAGDATLAVTADVVVNAAGAWADAVATQFGAQPAGVVPMRRTIIQFDPAEVAPAFPAAAGFASEAEYVAAQTQWPAVFDLHDTYYYKPEHGRVLASPADETPSEACDVHPDEWDVAVCVDRLEAAAPFRPRRITEKWAGLRCFAPDREFVIGPDAGAKGFYWLAGLGGYGIQTAMGNAKLFAGLIHAGTVPDELSRVGFDLAKVSPDRFRR